MHCIFLAFGNQPESEKQAASDILVEFKDAACYWQNTYAYIDNK